MSAITVDDELVHYEVLGRGKPIILIHGWLGSWRYWIPTMQQLAMKYRCYALDLWGFGDSGKDPRRYSFDNQLELLDHFLEKMGIPKAVLVGHGLGAAIAARYAVKPETAAKVHRMLVVAPPLLDAAPAQAAPRLASSSSNNPNHEAADTVLSKSRMLAQLSEEQLRIFQQPDMDLPRRNRPTESANKVTLGSPNLLRETFNAGHLDLNDLLGRAINPTSGDYEKLRVEVSKTDPKAVASSLDAFNIISTYRDLMESSVPVCALLGEDDSLLPKPDEDLLTQLAARDQCKLLVMNGIQHFPMLEDKAQFARVLKDLLEAPDINALEMKEEWRRRKR